MTFMMTIMAIVLVSEKQRQLSQQKQAALPKSRRSSHCVYFGRWEQVDWKRWPQQEWVSDWGDQAWF
jgi:hypothetical protein